MVNKLLPSEGSFVTYAFSICWSGLSGSAVMPFALDWWTLGGSGRRLLYRIGLPSEFCPASRSRAGDFSGVVGDCELDQRFIFSSSADKVCWLLRFVRLDGTLERGVVYTVELNRLGVRCWCSCTSEGATVLVKTGLITEVRRVSALVFKN